MKFFEYLLYVILAAVISTFFFILLCFANPDLYAVVNKVVNNHAANTVEVPEDASAAFSSEAFEEPEPEVEEKNSCLLGSKENNLRKDFD